MPKLRVLLQESKVNVELSSDMVNYSIDTDACSERYGDALCLITSQTNADIIKVPTSLYEQGYNRFVITLGKHGNVIVYAFKRGKYARKFISDFNQLGLKTFIGYNEIPLETFTGEEAYERMKSGEMMKLDGRLYRIENEILLTKDSGKSVWRKAKKKHLDRKDWYTL